MQTAYHVTCQLRFEFYISDPFGYAIFYFSWWFINTSTFIFQNMLCSSHPDVTPVLLTENNGRKAFGINNSLEHDLRHWLPPKDDVHIWKNSKNTFWRIVDRVIKDIDLIVTKCDFRGFSPLPMSSAFVYFPLEISIELANFNGILLSSLLSIFDKGNSKRILLLDFWHSFVLNILISFSAWNVPYLQRYVYI